MTRTATAAAAAAVTVTFFVRPIRCSGMHRTPLAQYHRSSLMVPGWCTRQMWLVVRWLVLCCYPAIVVAPSSTVGVFFSCIAVLALFDVGVFLQPPKSRTGLGLKPMFVHIVAVFCWVWLLYIIGGHVTRRWCLFGGMKQELTVFTPHGCGR